MRLETGIFFGVFLAGSGKLRLRQRFGQAAEKVVCRKPAAYKNGVLLTVIDGIHAVRQLVHRLHRRRALVDQGVQQCPCIMGSRLRRSRSYFRSAVSVLDEG